MDNTFVYEGATYNFKSILHSKLFRRFVRENKPLRKSDIGRALGYSYTNFLYRVLKWGILVAIMYLATVFTTMFSVNTVTAYLNDTLSLMGDISMAEIQGLGTAILFWTAQVYVTVFFMGVFIMYFFVGDSIRSHYAEFGKVLEARSAEINELLEEESKFRKDNNIEGATEWSITQHDKVSLLRAIFLEDLDSTSLSRKLRKSTAISDRPELSQYIISTKF